MHRTRSTWHVWRGGILAVLFLAAPVCPTPAVAGTVEVSFTNNTGVTVDDLHVYYGTPVNELSLVGILSNAPGAGPAAIVASDGGIPPFITTRFDLTWGPPGLPSGGGFTFNFGPENNLVSLFIGGQFDPFWTRQGGADIPVDLARDHWKSIIINPVGSVPEPSSLVLFGTGICGVLASSVAAIIHRCNQTRICK